MVETIEETVEVNGVAELVTLESDLIGPVRATNAESFQSSDSE